MPQRIRQTDFVTDPASLLVVLPTWVGDFVMATPTLRALRNRYPAARIVFLMEPNLRDLVRGGDWMDECVEWPARAMRAPWHRDFRAALRDLRRRRFDWAVLLSNSFRSALLTRLIGAKRRIGFDRDGRGWLLTDRIPVPRRRTAPVLPIAMPGRADPPAPPGRYPPVPMVEYYAALADALVCDRPGDDLELFVDPDSEESVGRRLSSCGAADARPLVVISPGAKYGSAKCWPADRFAALGDFLIERDHAAVVITCGPGEEPIARAIGSAMRHRAIVFDAPILTLGELKSLVRRADLVVCNDAGPRHFAKAFGVPVVTIFGPTHPGWTDTTRHRERIVRIDVDCGPCQQKVCPLGHLQCMTGVTPDMAYSAASSLLASPVRSAT